jgi:hypothetical protein
MCRSNPMDSIGGTNDSMEQRLMWYFKGLVRMIVMSLVG